MQLLKIKNLFNSASTLRAFIALRVNILFQYSTGIRGIGGFLVDVTKADVLIGPKLNVSAWLSNYR